MSTRVRRRHGPAERWEPASPERLANWRALQQNTRLRVAAIAASDDAELRRLDVERDALWDIETRLRAEAGRW